MAKGTDDDDDAHRKKKVMRRIMALKDFEFMLIKNNNWKRQRNCFSMCHMLNFALLEYKNG